VTQARAVVGRVLTYVVVALSTALFALPLLWLLSAPLDATPTFAVRLPSPITLGNFGQIGRDPYALWSLGNSLLLAIGTMAVVVAAAALAAYAISRVRIPGRNGLLYVLLLLSSVISGTAAMVPIFLLVSELHLVDSRGAVVGCHIPAEGFHRHDPALVRGVGAGLRRLTGADPAPHRGAGGPARAGDHRGLDGRPGVGHLPRPVPPAA
jgi:ABC-type glycerol-3-phosphate transport system permease component